MTPSPSRPSGPNEDADVTAGSSTSPGGVLALLWCYAVAGLAFQHVLGSDLDASGPFGIGFLVVLGLAMAALPAFFVFGVLAARVPVVLAGFVGAAAGVGAAASVVWVARENTSELVTVVLVAFGFGMAGTALRGLGGPSASAVGEVWWVRVPNDDPDEVESHKVRPAVIVEVGESGPTVLWATSQTKRLGSAGYLDVTDLAGWPADPGGKRSILALRSPYRPSGDDMVSRMGKLPDGSVALIRTALGNTRPGWQRGA